MRQFRGGAFYGLPGSVCLSSCWFEAQKLRNCWIDRWALIRRNSEEGRMKGTVGSNEKPWRFQFWRRSALNLPWPSFPLTWPVGHSLLKASMAMTMALLLVSVYQSCLSNDSTLPVWLSLSFASRPSFLASPERTDQPQERSSAIFGASESPSSILHTHEHGTLPPPPGSSSTLHPVAGGNSKESYDSEENIASRWQEFDNSSGSASSMEKSMRSEAVGGEDISGPPPPDSSSIFLTVAAGNSKESYDSERKIASTGPQDFDNSGDSASSVEKSMRNEADGGGEISWPSSVGSEGEGEDKAGEGRFEDSDEFEGKIGSTLHEFDNSSGSASSVEKNVRTEGVGGEEISGPSSIVSEGEGKVKGGDGRFKDSDDLELQQGRVRSSSQEAPNSGGSGSFEGNRSTSPAVGEEKIEIPPGGPFVKPGDEEISGQESVVGSEGSGKNEDASSMEGGEIENIEVVSSSDLTQTKQTPGNVVQIMEKPVDEPRAKLEQELLAAKQSIEGATQEDMDPSLYPVIYLNARAFSKSYKLMEEMFRIFVYKEGDRELVHTGPLLGIYASEGKFIEQMNRPGSFAEQDPEKAHMFFLPYSVTQMTLTIYVEGSRSMLPLTNFVKDYVNEVGAKYPFWNRSRGADHFFVSCHDWGPATARHHEELRTNAVKVVCNADLREEFVSGKDASLPEIYLHNYKPIKVGGPGPGRRRYLAFFAGQMHGHVRPVLLEHWKDKEPDMKIYEVLPKNIEKKMNYVQHMKSSKFCICAAGFEVNSPRIVESIYYDCVPVIIADNFVLPFSDVLNWSTFSVTIPESEIPNLKSILLSISEKHYRSMQKRLSTVRQHFLWNDQPVKYDVFHMILHSVWMSRLNQLSLNQL